MTRKRSRGIFVGGGIIFPLPYTDGLQMEQVTFQVYVREAQGSNLGCVTP
jgi:hypothetical protein